ncbi:MAG: CehA/McbA family metallohydrolase [Planctomycetes bacterium]|nr:CehA/McbA family metallohydrolase [Planctomycetota bacterium]
MKPRRLIVLLVALAALPLLGGMRGCVKTQPDSNHTSPAAPAFFRGDLHYHTTYSEDARRQMGDDVATSMRLAEWAGLDYLAVTDHRTDKVLSDPNFTSSKVVLLGGEEWGGTGHAGAIGISKQVPEIDGSRGPATRNAQVQAAIDDCHRQGGVFIINHPSSKGDIWIWNVERFDAVEVWNQPWHFRNPDTEPKEVDLTIRGMGLDQVGFVPNPWIRPCLQAKGGSNEQSLAFWEGILDDGIKVPMVGGGDRHMAFVPGHPSTWIYATELSPKGLLDGIRRGRTWVNRGPDGARVDFRADGDGDGSYETMLGDTLPLGGRIDFRVEVKGAVGGFLEVVANRTVRHKVQITSDPFVFSYSDTPSAYTWYRADVYEVLKDNVPGGQEFAQLIQNDPSHYATGVLNLIVFAKNYGLTFGTVPTALPTVVFDDRYDRILNLSVPRPGYCRGAMTSPIYAGSK